MQPTLAVAMSSLDNLGSKLNRLTYCFELQSFNRVYELRQELLKFLEEMKQNHFCELLRCESWIHKLAYLADIFQYLNIWMLPCKKAKKIF